jgi:hypothetical protein
LRNTADAGNTIGRTFVELREMIDRGRRQADRRLLRLLRRVRDRL